MLRPAGSGGEALRLFARSAGATPPSAVAAGAASTSWCHRPLTFLRLRRQLQLVLCAAVRLRCLPVCVPGPHRLRLPLWQAVGRLGAGGRCVEVAGCWRRWLWQAISDPGAASTAWMLCGTARCPPLHEYSLPHMLLLLQAAWWAWSTTTPTCATSPTASLCGWASPRPTSSSTRYVPNSGCLRCCGALGVLYWRWHLDAPHSCSALQVIGGRSGSTAPALLPQFLPPLLVDSAIRIDFFMFSKVHWADRNRLLGGGLGQFLFAACFTLGLLPLLVCETSRRQHDVPSPTTLPPHLPALCSCGCTACSWHSSWLSSLP